MTRSTVGLSRPRPRDTLIKLIVLIDFSLFLMPPLHWYFGDGIAAHALGYFLGSSLLVALSLPIISVYADHEEY
ncbi:protein of unknown function [Pseudomonas sp. JV551A1]|uniref:Uncharacterized protein n=1 Tax=Pseudomonas inefficax TaxID=2078786 RepID=A0AAQ1SUG6_9PSED|nr:protein of unknown function [Pseudomonas sp. JV551A1]SPO62053.1 protein of unknown function [Pseudomonas inefficax]